MIAGVMELGMRELELLDDGEDGRERIFAGRRRGWKERRVRGAECWAGLDSSVGLK